MLHAHRCALVFHERPGGHLLNDRLSVSRWIIVRSGAKARCTPVVLVIALPTLRAPRHVAPSDGHRCRTPPIGIVQSPERIIYMYIALVIMCVLIKRQICAVADTPKSPSGESLFRLHYRLTRLLPRG